MDQLLLPWDVWRARSDLHHALSIHYCCWWLPCPDILTIHDVIPLIFPDHYMKTGFNHKMLYMFARRVDHILTPSEHAKKDVHRLLDIPLDRITVTYEAADEYYRPIEDPALLERVQRRYQVSAPYILYVGGFTKEDPRKNVRPLIDVYKELRLAGFHDHQLVLAGKHGDGSRVLMEEIDRHGLKEGVVFTDYVDPDDLPLLYSGARCFVFPSSYEGFGLPPLEAISCGTPTIAYNNSSIPEVLGDAGILVDGEDPQQLFEAIRELLVQDRLVEELRHKGLHQANRFSWEKTARQTHEVYCQIRARKKNSQ